jgi:hypothetical protein
LNGKVIKENKMQALISPNEISPYVVSWTYDHLEKRWIPIIEDIPDSWRVAQVQEDSFEVAPPLFWTDCANDVVADEWYYQTSTGNILPVPAIPPIPDNIPSANSQPVVSGAQTI